LTIVVPLVVLPALCLASSALVGRVASAPALRTSTGVSYEPKSRVGW
jgi:hypothetical protein